MASDNSPDLDALLQRVHDDHRVEVPRMNAIDLTQVGEAVRSALADSDTSGRNRPAAPSAGPPSEPRNQQPKKGKMVPNRRPDRRAAKG
jgi:hypothetical protein